MVNDNKSNGTGVRRLLKAFSCSLKGFSAAYGNEAAFRQELLLCLVLFPLSFVVSSSLTEWVVLISTLLFLLFAELLNSAIEALADSVSVEYHELLGRAKDLGSAAVLVAIILVFLVWIVAFIK